jgi:hypothetical protein
MKSGTVPGFRPKTTVPGAAWAGGLLWQLGARARRGAVTAGRSGAVAREAMGRRRLACREVEGKGTRAVGGVHRAR